ncbi:MAG: SufE family protein [Acidimicrobiia bacterium]
MCRRECPTVRGHTRILDEGLNGATTQEILEVSSDTYLHMGLQAAVSPLRLRGIGGVVGALKRRVAEQQQAQAAS